MPATWAGDIVARLTDTTRCPACGEHLASSVCASCGLDVSGRRAQEVWRLSVAAADALRERDSVLDAMRRAQGTVADGGRGPRERAADGQASPARTSGAVPVPPAPARALPTPAVSATPMPDMPAPATPVPTSPVSMPPVLTAGTSTQTPPTPVRAPASPTPTGSSTAPAQPSLVRPVRQADPPAATRPDEATTRRPSGPGISLQPILAGAGAALLAVSAVVFVFFTFGDNLLLRAVVTGIVTVTAVTVGAMLRRAGLRTTSEAVAALAVVLAWVDVELGLQAGLLGALDPAMARAVVLAVLAPGFVVLGSWLRVRSWVSAGLVSAPLVPALVAAGLPWSVWSMWWWVLALLLVGVVAWAAMRTAPVVGERSGSPLVVELSVLRVVRAVGPPLALMASLGGQAVAPTAVPGETAVLWSGVVLCSVALGTWLRVRSWVSAGLVSAPLVPVLVVLSLPGATGSGSWWVLALVLVAAVAWAAMRLLPAFAGRLGGAVTFELEAVVLRMLRAAGPPLALLVSLGAQAVPPLTRAGTTAVLWSAVVLFSTFLGYRLRVRSWISAALLAAPVVPVLVVLSLPASAWSAWWWALALGLVALVAWAARRAVPVLSERLGASFVIEARTLRVVRAAGFPLALAASCVAGPVSSLTSTAATAILWSAVVVAAVALGYRLQVRSWLSAALLAAPVVPLLVALSLPGSVWSVWTVWWVPRWVLALVLVALVAWAAMRLFPVLAVRLDLRHAPAFTMETRVLRLVRAAGLPAALAASALAVLADPTAPLSRLGTVALLWSAVVVTGMVLGHTLRVRAWSSAGVLAAPAVPLVLLAAAEPPDGSWLPTVAVLAAALTTLLARAAATVSGPRIGSSLRPETIALDTVALVAVPVAVLLSFDVRQLDALPGLGGTAVLVALAAVTVAVLRRATHHRHWTVFGGVLAVVAGGLLGAVGDSSTAGWVPFGSACVWTALALLTAPRLLRAAGLGSVRGALHRATRDDLLLSGWIVTAVAAAPALMLVPVRVMDAWVAAWSASGAGWTLPTEALLAPAGPTVGTAASLASLNLPWAHLGIVALAVVTLLAARLARPGRRVEAVVAPVVVLLAAIGIALDPRLPTVVSLAVLALLALTLVAGTADRAAAWRGLRPAVAAVQEAVKAVVRASGRLRVIGGTGLTGADLRLARTTALTGAFVATGMLLAFSWVSRPTAAVGALVVCALLLSLRGVLRPTTHPWLVGAGYVYPLAVLGVVLAWLDLSVVAAVCTVSAVASLVTIAVTLWARSSRTEWYVVLGVTATPFAAGVITVVFERTWWSAGAAAAMLALELVLLLTTRSGLPSLLRSGAAFLLLPTASVMVTSAGAMILEVSGSPYVLPATALFVSAVAGGAARVAERIADRVPDGGPQLAAGVRSSLERSALLTGAITILLAYARPAAGSDVAVAVLLLLMAGAALVAREPGRGHLWPLVAALGLAALWTALAGGEVALVEAYTLPPALGAVVVGALIAWRRGRTDADADADGGGGGGGTATVAGRGPITAATHAWRLAAVGAGLAVVPSLLVHATRTEPADWRAFALVGVAVAALGAAHALGLRVVRDRIAFLGDSWTRQARFGLVAVGALASLAGVVESLHVAWDPVSWLGYDRGATPSLARLTWYDGSPLGVPVGAGWTFAVGLGWSLLAGALLIAAAAVARRTAGGRLTPWLDRWGMAPGLVLGTLGAIENTRPVWAAIVSLLVLELALLALLVLITRRAGRAVIGAPPWLVWLCAAAVAIAAWSPRELRVEAFSVMLGAGLIWSGATALRRWLAAGEPEGATGTLMTWPVGYQGSWRTVGWGIAALVGPSVLSTITDPLTIRASWVVLAALASVLIGSRLRLSAPFWIGVWTLALEVVVVFAKLGVGVSPLPWILTLVPAAVVLLIIATLDERRTAASGGTAAYLRDLR